MKKLQLYILKHTARSFVPAFIALLLLMTVGFCMQLLNEGLDIVRLGPLLPKVVVCCLPMVLPSAFLTAVIMAFGRLSADNELLAVRAAGVHLFRVVFPVLIAALAVSVGTCYLQFETLPRTNGEIKALRYAALKQVLFNRVAMSWRRTLSFPPAHIQYQDFTGGQMRGVTILQLADGRPEMVITAQRSNLRPDPKQAESVVFELLDCQIAAYDAEGDDLPTITQAGRAIYTMPVVPREADVVGHRKFMSLGEMLKERARLRRSVADSAEHYDDLEKEARAAREESRKLRRWLSDIADRANDAGRKYDKYAREEPVGKQRRIDSQTRLAAEGRRELADLDRRLAECNADLDAAREAAEQDLERQADLQTARDGILTKIQACRKQIAKSTDEVQRLRRSLKQSADKAGQLAEEIAELEKTRGDLAEQLEAKRAVVQAYADHDDLLGLTIRVHKRLAQGMSVFVFALIGIPLGIMASRRSVMIAFGLSFSIVIAVFYPLLILGTVAAEKGTFEVAPAVWSGSAFMVLIGAVLMVKLFRK